MKKIEKEYISIIEKEGGFDKNKIKFLEVNTVCGLETIVFRLNDKYTYYHLIHSLDDNWFLYDMTNIYIN